MTDTVLRTKHWVKKNKTCVKPKNRFDLNKHHSLLKFTQVSITFHGYFLLTKQHLSLPTFSKSLAYSLLLKFKILLTNHGEFYTILLYSIHYNRVFYLVQCVSSIQCAFIQYSSILISTCYSNIPVERN